MVRGLRQRFLGLCVPPLLFCALDATFTLVGQSSDYWHWRSVGGNVNEASPTFNQLLAVHPLAFVGGIAVWAAIFVAIILLLPDTLALMVCLTVTLGHTFGACTWLYFCFKFGYQLCTGMFLLAALTLAVGIRWGWQAGPKESLQFNRLPQAWRWGLIAVLAAISVYVFLWPRSVGT